MSQDTNPGLPLVTSADSIRDTMEMIDGWGKGVALVVDEGRRVLATVTDGDVRRAVLGGVDLGLPVRALLERRAPDARPSPLTASVGTPDAELLRLMNEWSVRHIPIVDRTGLVVDLAVLSDLVKERELPVTAVIMAGGYGTRLHPLTERVPKPMLPVGDRPLLELTLERLRHSGVRRVSLATHYRSEDIAGHFGNGQDFGIELSYVTEDSPLGTAGALGLMEPPREPILVLNGDILTRVDFRALLAFHKEQQADLTVGVREYDVEVPYGVVECEGGRVRRLAEKPVFKLLVNAGVYLLEPAAHQFIPRGRRFNMTDLIKALLDDGRPVATFPIWEYWLDIGRLADYEQAQEDMVNGRLHT